VSLQAVLPRRHHHPRPLVARSRADCRPPDPGADRCVESGSGTRRLQDLAEPGRAGAGDRCRRGAGDDRRSAQPQGPPLPRAATAHRTGQRTRASRRPRRADDRGRDRCGHRGSVRRRAVAAAVTHVLCDGDYWHLSGEPVHVVPIGHTSTALAPPLNSGELHGVCGATVPLTVSVNAPLLVLQPSTTTA